jgi:hypothetical protein
MTIDRTDPVLSRRDAWHQSTLETLLDGCSWQYFLTYVLNLPAASKPASVSGVAVHSAIEQYERNRQAGGEPIALDVLLETAREHVVSVLPDNEDAVSEAQAAVRHWYSTPTSDGPSHREWLEDYDALAIEPYFRQPLVDGAKPIAGWIDGVYQHRETGEVILVDHKTANNFSRWGRDGDEHRHQAAMYAVALVLDPAYPVTELPRMVYLVSRKTKGRGKTFEGARRVIVQPILEDVRRLGERIREAENLVASENYTRRPEWGLCKPEWCVFYEKCMKTGELAGTPESVRLRVYAAEV